MKCMTDRRRQVAGFTLVELMIALVLGLIVIGGSLALFVSQRVTSKMSGQMVDIQAEGRIALDALARDLRAAGDFGCWPVSNPIDGRLNKMVFDVYKGGLRGFDNGTAVQAAANSLNLYGLADVKAASPDDSSVVMLTGIAGSLTSTATDMTSEHDDLVVKAPVQDFKANDVAVVTDCVNWVKFQVTDVTAGSAADTVNLAHEGHTSTAWGGGNQFSALGASFRKDSTVGRLDSVWWFIGTVGQKKGLYRFSPRDGTPILVSDKILGMQVVYDVDSNADGVADALGKKASEVTDWTQVRSASVQMLLRSSATVSGGGSTTVTSFAGVTVPSDNHVYMPLQMAVALRNQ